MARKRKKTFDESGDDLNLVPIMNLVVCLIPMVLYGMAMVKVGVVNVNQPRFDHDRGVAAEKPLRLTVAIADDGYRVTAAGATLPRLAGADDGSAPLKIPKKDGGYDYVELYNTMVAIKKQFPKETIVNLTAERGTPFKFVLGTMDVMRVHLESDTYDDLAGFQSASVRFKDRNPDLLWPDVVFAVAQ